LPPKIVRINQVNPLLADIIMAMGTDERIDFLAPEGEIYTCPACGYTDGFHVSFKMMPTAEKAEIYLICPNCHSRFRLGWQVSLSQSDA
jgi:predicted RNA-binding Zn-ribbon protein involved in translation (DUF1610 family)